MANSIIGESQAAKFRQTSGLGPNDPIQINSLLLKIGIVAVFWPLSTEFSGMAVKHNEKAFILINSNHAIGRQNFTICHELYHLFVQKTFTAHHCSAGAFDKKNSEEYNADYFASVLLMPKDGISTLIPETEFDKNKISLGTILLIEQTFGCSRQALIYRLEKLNLISQEYGKQLIQHVKRDAKLHGFTTELYTPGRKNLILGDYGNKAKRLYDDEFISEANFAGLMHEIGIDIYSEGSTEDEQV